MQMHIPKKLHSNHHTEQFINLSILILQNHFMWGLLFVWVSFYVPNFVKACLLFLIIGNHYFPINKNSASTIFFTIIILCNQYFHDNIMIYTKIYDLNYMILINFSECEYIITPQSRIKFSRQIGKFYSLYLVSIPKYNFNVNSIIWLQILISRT